jgi:4-methylaminobutanoate oxidase (formaldehyde-forming)
MSPARHVSQTVKEAASAVVIGGGIAGCSAAYHLARYGSRQVVLLERANLSCGTTWHSTGNMETYRDDPMMLEMVRYGVSMCHDIQAESGQQVGWRNVGRVAYTDREARMLAMQAMPEIGRALGVEVELLTAREVARKLPIIDAAGLLGGVWIPSDGRVNPTDVVMAFAKAARQRGVSIREHAAVREVLVREGSVCGVATDTGIIECDTVVVAAGLWSNEIVKTCGIGLPLHALEHQYVITGPIAGVDASLPLFLSYDDQLYGREEVGGLIVGSLDDRAIPVAARGMAESFSFSLLNERWEQFEPYLQTALQRFPLLRAAGVKMLLNGPESFTPDGRMLLGPIAGVEGLYTACGFNSNGIALSPAAGRYIAEWITEGCASADVTALDVRRFSPVQATEAYMRERVTEIPGYVSRLHEPIDDYATARFIRRSPIHEQLLRSGAQFTSVNGWERVAWVQDATVAGGWLEAVASEVVAGRGGVLVIDRSADAKIGLRGAANSLLATLQTTQRSPLQAAARESAVAICKLLPLRGRAARTEAQVLLFEWDEAAVLLTAGPEQETRLQEWTRHADLGVPIQLQNQTAGWAMWEFHGPNRERLLSHLLTDDGLMARNRYSSTRRMLGPVEVRVFMDPSQDSTLLLVATDCAGYAWDCICREGAQFGLKVGGQLAQEALRIIHGVPAFGRELTPASVVRNAFHDEAPMPADPPPRVLTALSTMAPMQGFGSGELLLRGDLIVGKVTSRARMPDWRESLLLANLSPDDTHGPLEVLFEGARWPVSVRRTLWHDLIEREGA